MTFKRDLSIAIPASLVFDIPHLREKTQRIGMVGRAVAIFGVDEIIVFPDSPDRDQRDEIRLINTILSYLETPQYLRKRLFKLMPELEYAGVLPPLRTRHHPLRNRVEDLVDGEYREAAVVAQTVDGALVDVGVERHALIQNQKLPPNMRVTVRISKKNGRLEARVTDRGEIERYWGYRVTSSDTSIGKLLKTRKFDLVIATSKHGKPFHEASQGLLNRWGTSHRILVAFGAPTRGLYEIAKQESLSLDDIADFVVNTFPRQEVETVRTEEAVYVALGILSLMSAKG
ncbi:MAG: RNA methyltransferase [Candidatus Bathyarchaeia archaeon]